MIPFQIHAPSGASRHPSLPQKRCKGRHFFLSHQILPQLFYYKFFRCLISSFYNLCLRTWQPSTHPESNFMVRSLQPPRIRSSHGASDCCRHANIFVFLQHGIRLDAKPSAQTKSNTPAMIKIGILGAVSSI